MKFEVKSVIFVTPLSDLLVRPRLKGRSYLVIANKPDSLVDVYHCTSMSKDSAALEDIDEVISVHPNFICLT